MSDTPFFPQVSRPLDFSTIKKRQKKGRYAKFGVSGLWEDISTVYRNAQLYNQVWLWRVVPGDVFHGQPAFGCPGWWAGMVHSFLGVDILYSS